MPDEGNGHGKEEQNVIRFEFEKTPQFRNIHVDGVFGGLAPKGLINMAIFNERRPIPKATTHVLEDDHHLGEELVEARDVRSSVFRSVEANLIMDLSTAISIQRWLADKIAQHEKAIEEQEKRKVNE